MSQAADNTPTRRVLVTGSREFADRQAVADALRAASALLPCTPRECLLVHGSARGLDAIASDTAQGLGWRGEERHPADWKLHGGCSCRDTTGTCRFAGPRRNLEMVRKGADLALAFPMHQMNAAAGSRGTWHCAAAARDAGLPVLVAWHGTFFPLGNAGRDILARRAEQLRTHCGPQGELDVVDAWLPF